ncbi:MAG: ArnT family glycosyltransferase, partial [Pyrinomonadaceae bacterium]
SIMFMLAALTAIWAFFFYRISRTLLGTTGASISAFLLVLLPTTQLSTSAVMLDIPVALMMLFAMGAYARYLKSERTADAFIFGLWVVASLLVKYNAFALALLPPLCVVIAGRHYLWRSKSFWLPAAVVVVIAGPWYFIMRHLVLYAAQPGSSSPSVAANLAATAKGIVLVAGPVVFVLAVIGSILVSTNRGSRSVRADCKDRSLYIVAAAMVVAVFIFHGAIYPLYPPRYLLPAAPALILLSWPAVRYIHSVLSIRPALAAVALLVVAAAHAASTFSVPAKKTRAYVSAAEAVLSCGLPKNGAVLVSADPVGEGMLTAEFVMHDRRPDHYVVRASKVLATQTLMGDEYRLNYRSPEEIMTLLDSIPIAMVVIEQCRKGGCGEHENVLSQTAIRYPERWRLSSVVPNETGSPILIYQIAGNEGKALQTLRIDMTYTLGTWVEKQRD